MRCRIARTLRITIPAYRYQIIQRGTGPDELSEAITERRLVAKRGDGPRRRIEIATEKVL